MINRSFTTFILSLVTAAALLLFQNCSNLNFTSGSNPEVQQSGGNGDGYVGKPYRHYQDQACADGSYVEGEILQGAVTVLTRENCAPISPPRELSPSEYQVTAQGIVYGNRLFVPADPSFAQNKSLYENTQVATLNLDNAVQAGNLLVCLTEISNGLNRAVTSVAGSGGAALTRIHSAPLLGGWLTELWYLENAPAGITGVTVTVSGIAEPVALDCFEYNNIATSGALESETIATGVGPGPAVSLPGAGSDSLVFFYLVADGGGVAASAPGFSTRSNLNGNLAGDAVAVNAGPITANPQLNAPIGWHISMVSFRRRGP